MNVRSPRAGAWPGLVRRLSAAWGRLRTAIYSARSRNARLRRALREQEAVRHVATLVARGASPSEAFWVVARELGRLLKADYVNIGRFEPDGTVCQLAQYRDPGVPHIGAPFGGRWPMGDNTAAAEAHRTGRPVRRTSASIGGEIGDWLTSRGIGEVVACPVTVDGRIWGKMTLLFLAPRAVPADIEERMDEFVQLIACTIAQAEYRAELIASRARLVTAADATRRRVERDLHDGTQPRLIALGLALHEAQENASGENLELRQLLAQMAEGLAELLAQLQEISRGLYPAALAREGLTGAIKALTRRCPVPTELHLDLARRLPERLEVTLYYVVSESLTNILKHAHASLVSIDLSAEADAARLTVRDNGVGGADPRAGSGLTGLKDRVEAAAGTLEISSPAGGGTCLSVTIPPQALSSDG